MLIKNEYTIPERLMKTLKSLYLLQGVFSTKKDRFVNMLSANIPFHSLAAISILSLPSSAS